MHPKLHILYGLIFAFLFWLFFPLTAWYNLVFIFLASFLIDFDHYMAAVWNTKKWSLIKALKYYKKYRKGDFHVFHTVEFHALVLAMGFIFNPFFYVFIGMFFHSLIDLISLLAEGGLYKREFFLTNWIRTKINKGFTKS